MHAQQRGADPIALHGVYGRSWRQLFGLLSPTFSVGDMHRPLGPAHCSIEPLRVATGPPRTTVGAADLVNDQFRARCYAAADTLGGQGSTQAGIRERRSIHRTMLGNVSNGISASRQSVAIEAS